MNHYDVAKQVKSDLNPLAAQRKVTIMTNSKSMYQGLFDYAKENSQTRKLFQEYWQQDKKQAPEWQSKLSPELKRAALPASLLGFQAKPIAELRKSNIGYEGLLEYARQNAVKRDLFKESAHPNLSDWRANLNYEKATQPRPVVFAKVA